jgi:spore coat protein U-like protein
MRHRGAGRPSAFTAELTCAAIAWLALTCSASAQMRCSILSAAGPRFGAYDTLDGAPAESVGYVSFRCENVGPSDMIAIELSRGESNSFQPRRMSRETEQCKYNLYLDAAHTLIWGDGSRGTARYQVRPMEGRAEWVPIYGRIPPRQRVAPGNCSDRVTLTVKY